MSDGGRRLDDVVTQVGAVARQRHQAPAARRLSDTCDTGVTNVTTNSGVVLNGVYQEYFDGVCWQLVLAYSHAAGVNDALVYDTFPASPTGSYSQMQLSTLGVANADVAQTRWHCTASAHGRVMDFTTSNADVIALVVSEDTTSVDVSDWTDGFTALTDHTTYLPASTDGVVYGTPAITDFTFYLAGNYHWGIRGAGSRWECDDDSRPDDDSQTTLHQVWVELTPTSGDTLEGVRPIRTLMRCCDSAPPA